VQPESRQVPHQRHGRPRQDRETSNGEAEADLRSKVRERVEDDKAVDVIGIPEGEGQRDGAAEGLADDNCPPRPWRNALHGVCAVGRQYLETLSIVSQRVRCHAIGSLEEWNLAVKQLDWQ
jgi:hypothetical protein